MVRSCLLKGLALLIIRPLLLLLLGLTLTANSLGLVDVELVHFFLELFLTVIKLVLLSMRLFKRIFLRALVNLI
jgi:hypothetical protein